MTPQVRYPLYVLVSASASACGLVLTEIALRFYVVPPAGIAVASNSAGGLFLLTCAFARGSRGWRGWPAANWPAADWLRLGAAALTTYALGFILLYEAVDRIGSSKATLLGRLEVLFVVGLAVLFLGERWSLRHWLASFLALGGATLVNFDPGAWRLQLGLGEALTLLAAFVYAVGIVILKSLVDRQDGLLVTGFGLLLGAAMLAPVAWFGGGGAGAAVGPGWVVGVLLVTRGLLLGTSWVTYNVAMEHIGASRCSVLFLSVVFFTVLVQVVAAALAPGLGLQVPANLPTALAGGAVIGVAIGLLQRRP